MVEIGSATSTDSPLLSLDPSGRVAFLDNFADRYSIWSASYRSPIIDIVCSTVNISNDVHFIVHAALYKIKSQYATFDIPAETSNYICTYYIHN